MRNSSVIQTQTWLNEFFNACVDQSSKSPYVLQCEVLCAPLADLFPGINPEELQYELLNHGLFDPFEWKDIGNQVKTMEEQSIWQIVDQEYQLLKGLWKGPEVSIYIYPLTKLNLEEQAQAPTKNGVAYKRGLFLFLSEGLSIEEIKALLAHEYNHVCRLNYLGLDPHEIPLKDSLIIEGFGEFAVKELYGEKWLAPWTNLYSFEESIKVWNKHFIPQLNLMGSENHQIYLYGKIGGHLPKWIGYHIGYQIIDSFQKKHGPFNDYELYQKSSDELIAGSKFPANKLF
jgi:uncharacterized protein YjaZ